jgi:hypothetical protein
MKRNRLELHFALMILLVSALAHAQEVSKVERPSEHATYLGLDRNNYPGDENLKSLHRTFSYMGYWLSHPPSAQRNTWIGKRQKIEDAGFGFLVLYNGRAYAELRSVGNAIRLGRSDAAIAVGAAHREGFPGGTVIFLDQEEGGRMLPEQKAYIYAWVDAVNASGFAAGVYCSGIPNQETATVSVVTADDIREHGQGRAISFWIANDSCPPAPGCVFPQHAPAPANSGVGYAEVWQFAQSPRRPAVTAKCVRTYNADGNCYPPEFPADSGLHIDVETANSPDPSHGRSR